MWIAIAWLVAANGIAACFLKNVKLMMNDHVENALEDGKIMTWAEDLGFRLPKYILPRYVGSHRSPNFRGSSEAICQALVHRGIGLKQPALCDPERFPDPFPIASKAQSRGKCWRYQDSPAKL